MMETLLRITAVCVVVVASFGASAIQIYVDSRSSSVELYAAQELADVLSTILKTKIEPVNNTCVASDPEQCVAVGTIATRAVGLKDALVESLGLEGYIATNNGTSAGVQKNAYAITGKPGAPRGTLYGAYAFLSELGVRFYNPNVTQLPPSPAGGILPSVDLTKIPSLEYRSNNEYVASSNMDWAVRMHYNGVPYPDQVGGGVVYAEPPGFVHTSYKLLSDDAAERPPADLFKSNNEWFWPHDDPNTYGQLCWSNASLVDFILGRVKTMLRQQPQATIISVSQNDNQNYCKDPGDMAIIQEEGSPIGPLLRAVNTIAAGIKDEFPNVAVDTLAYQYTRPAPQITKPLPNVIIRLCSIECNFGAPLTDETNAAFQVDMKNWSRVSQRTYIWNYVTNFGNFVMPFPNWFNIGPNIRFFLDHGVKGIFEEGAYEGPGGDLNELKDYLMGRMLWDPSADADAIIADFLDYYYGDAAPFIAEYMQTMTGAVKATGYYMHENFSPTADLYTNDTMYDCAVSFQRAVQAVGNDATFRPRVDRTKLAVYYLVLWRWDDVQAFAQSHALPWPLEATKTESFAEFSRVYNATGITHLSEGGHDLAWFKSQLFPTH
eukprot:m.10550 g.10550  ORF g.10550 m.10550 type:complete len:605 (-) comp7608_c0_seq1:319-2133(-)